MSSIKERIPAIINSRDRINKANLTSNFTFSFNRNVERVSEIILESIQIPYSFYSINSSNNRLCFNDNPADFIDIPPGNYNMTSLAAVLETVLTAKFPGSNTVTYSTNTYKLTLNIAVAAKINSSTDVPESTAADILGFRVSTGTAVSHTADSAVNIAGPNYLVLASSFLSTHVHNKILYSSNVYAQSLFTIPVNSSPGSIITANPSFTLKLAKKINILTTDVIDIQLKDELGNIVNLNGLDIAIEFTLVTT